MIRKAIFPVGGLGTRFLPATKAMPKEMLPVVDKPLIQYAVEEAAAVDVAVPIAQLERHHDLARRLPLERRERERRARASSASARAMRRDVSRAPALSPRCFA